AAWLTTTPSSGTGLAPTTVNVTTNPSGLSAGLYTATITVASAEASNSPLYVLVNLIVNSISSSGDNYALMTAEPLALSFYEQINTATSSAKSISISSAGTLDFNWSITDDADWLSVSPSTGIGSESTNAEATVTLTSLTAGSYSANITITAEGALNNPLIIPVSLTIYATSDGSGAGNNNGGSNSNTSGMIPSTPMLYSPSKGASDVYPAPVLIWAPAADSTSSISYWLQISTDTEFSNMLINKIIYSTSYQTTNVEFGKVYYWRVKAANSTGMSSWSETWEFRINDQGEATNGTSTKACFITKLRFKN
ncbi:MAG: hypothetical protein HZA48_12190, partial [Planctomycetes bacterium]|nr:hypothetical protein [Planctomycetota bacterium]